MRGPEPKKSYSKMVWDGDSREIFGRTCKSWGEFERKKQCFKLDETG